MKRDAYGEDGPVHKRQRQTDDEVTFLIPSKVAGSIIGKGGSNISKLRNEGVGHGAEARGAPLQRFSVAGPAPPPPPPRRPPPTRHAVQSLYNSPRLPRPRTEFEQPSGVRCFTRPVPSHHTAELHASSPPATLPRPVSSDLTRRDYSATTTSESFIDIVLSISACDIDTILEIVKDILPNLADGALKGGNEDLDIRLLIHQSRAGCVIGKAGAKIKELREKTGARLKIFSSTAPQSTERVVQLVGSKEAVAAGVREVLDLIRQARTYCSVPIKGAIQNYDPHNYDDYYADEYGGFGGGAGAAGRGGRGAPPRSPRSAPPRAPRPPAPRAAPPGPRGAFNDYGGPPRGFGGPPRANFPGPTFPGGNFGGGFNRNSGGQETSTQVTIPKDLAGAIIGKAGSRIRKIRAESGAGIEIAEPLPGSSDRIITITGTPQRIQMAQYLLQQSVHESNPNLGRGNF
ncbi:Heterogeneous nuclear ribonucleoprotein K [Papilio xuthus]|uniref:Heterogeneous nuclear ribonucleoprotein K n=1 Tax=Papilio xuthus TaxID=66420 RepID=A0A194QEZ6_PAPXU|nr:Heterogeneous nuclear ribonucleoprotein K [Papilio xuthus]